MASRSRGSPISAGSVDRAWPDWNKVFQQLTGSCPFPCDLQLILREMNRLGMIIDISGASEQTMKDVLAHSTAPVILSHTAARHVCDSPRNVGNEILRLLVNLSPAQNVPRKSLILFEGQVNVDCTSFPLATERERRHHHGSFLPEVRRVQAIRTNSPRHRWVGWATLYREAR